MSLNGISGAILGMVVIWLPIPMGGMMTGAFPWFTGCMILVAGFGLLADFSEKDTTNRYWAIVWLTFTAGVLLSIIIAKFDFYKPLIGIPQTEITENYLNISRKIEFWVFFTLMWIAAWRTSRLSRNLIMVLFYAIFISSLFQASYGIVSHLSGSQSILGLWEKRYYLGDATGTFINRNHFAGFLAISWPLVLSGLISAKPFLLDKHSSILRVSIAICYSLLITFALVLSHSRMGAVVALSGVTVWGYITTRNKKKSHRRMLWLGLGIIVLSAVWFGAEDIVSRFTLLESGDGRLKIWRQIFQFPITAWLAGIGPGNIEEIFRLVQQPNLEGKLVFAHNDYLEFVLEFGLISTFILVITFSCWGYKAFPIGSLTLRAGAIGSFAAILIHSTVDFNLQIPAVALYFWVVVGLLFNPNMTNTKVQNYD